MEYTKGEWYYLRDPENRHHVMSRGKSGDMEQNVAIMSVRPEQEANARLIAAAPDLYEALKLFTERYEMYKNRMPTALILPSVRAERALAKAEGG